MWLKGSIYNREAIIFLAEINALEISSMEHTSFSKAQSLLPSN
jgi:hypothetical protein